MTNLEARVREEDPEDVVVSTLSHLTSKLTSRLFGGDLESSVAILRTVANRLQYLLQTQSESFYNKESYVQQVFQNVLRSASNLLSEENRQVWFDLHPSQRMKTATALLLALEENAFLLAEVTNSPEIIQETSNSIGKISYYSVILNYHLPFMVKCSLKKKESKKFLKQGRRRRVRKMVHDFALITMS